MSADTQRRLLRLVKAMADIEGQTQCPDPHEGGCIGGPIPGLGCIHEAARFVRRELEEITRELEVHSP